MINCIGICIRILRNYYHFATSLSRNSLTIFCIARNWLFYIRFCLFYNTDNYQNYYIILYVQAAIDSGMEIPKIKAKLSYFFPLVSLS